MSDDLHLKRAWRAAADAWQPEGDLEGLTRLARELERAGRKKAAACVWNRAHGLAPDDDVVRARRAALLDELALELGGIRFRWVPQGTFVMGSDHGDHDEGPAHPVSVPGFWIQETPLTWAAFQRVLGWTDGYPPEDERPTEGRNPLFHLTEDNKIRYQYCENGTEAAHDWHAHVDDVRLRELFGAPPRDDEVVEGYDLKPMVAVGWQDVLEVAEALSTDQVRVDLPTEAQWEYAARGGRIGARYPWGDTAPTDALADFDHFGAFAIRPPRSLPPNGYGLFGMVGGVWEWCRDWYAADTYARRAAAGPLVEPTGPERGLEKVLRGGSWADCADALRVTFRMSSASGSWRDEGWGGHSCPILGARLVVEPRSEDA